MYLRIRVLDPNELSTGAQVIMIAKQQTKVGAILSQPGVLEWWDLIEWNEVKIVEKDADMKSPYERAF